MDRVPAGDPGRLAQAVLRLHAEPALWEQSARDGLRAVAGHFSPAAAASALEAALAREPVHAERPLVSVIVPVHEGERFLAEALESALGQDYGHVEVIVVDDGSTDGSARIAQARPVRLIRQPNRGVCAARNAGLAAARGELIAFLDQDDVFARDKLSTQVAQMAEHAELDLVIGRLRLELEPGTDRPAWWNPAWDPDGEVAVQLGTVLARRRAFDVVGRFDEGYAIAGDADWIARLKDAGLEWKVTPDVVMTYRVHEHNNVHDQARMHRELLRAMRGSVARRRPATETLVSVVIAVRDGAPFLADAIDSAFGQTHHQVDVIVVDDGSQDGSAEIAERYGDRVRCVRQGALGIGAARNRGVALASGVTFLDADDLWPADRLERLLAAFAADPSLDMAFGHAQEFRDRAQPGPPKPAHLSGSVMVRRSAWQRVGGYATQYAVGEFLDWFMRARDAGLRETMLPDTVLLRRLHATNTTGRDRSQLNAYAHVLKASLDRRRAAEAGTTLGTRVTWPGGGNSTCSMRRSPATMRPRSPPGAAGARRMTSTRSTPAATGCCRSSTAAWPGRTPSRATSAC